MRFTDLIWKNLARRMTRSSLTLLALATAIASVVSLIGIAEGFTRSFADVYAAHGVDIVVSRQGSADRLSSSVDMEFADRIASLPRVDRAAGVLLETMSLENLGIYGIPAMGVAADSWLLRDYEFSAGGAFPIDIQRPKFDTSSVEDRSELRQVLLGAHLADRTNVEVGSEVSLFDEPYRVVGIFKSPSVWENGSMILPLSTLQSLTDRTGQVTYINVVLQGDVDAAGASETIGQIEALDRRLLPLATTEFVETDTRMQLARGMAWMTSAVAILIGSIGMLNTMLTSVLERTKEIGILRAIGWPTRRVVSMILLESCGLALVASVLGCALAIGLTWGLSKAPAAGGMLHPAIDGWILAQGIVLALVIGLLGAMLPAWRAARLLPTDAFREH
jgi:putative ABC transport system permease protein